MNLAQIIASLLCVVGTMLLAAAYWNWAEDKMRRKGITHEGRVEFLRRYLDEYEVTYQNVGPLAQHIQFNFWPTVSIDDIQASLETLIKR